MAVGNSRASAASPTVPLVERWNGSKWSAVPSPIPKGSTGTYLDAVSCASAKACIAVGNYTSRYTSGSALALRWNGKKWALMTSPHPARSAVTQLLGVSCTGAGPALTCWAVGQYSHSMPTARRTTGPSAPHGSGRSSQPQRPAIKAQLMAVSCSSAKSCFAAGSWDHGYGATLVERWNGAVDCPQVGEPAASRSASCRASVRRAKTASRRDVHDRHRAG
jgi:hypothetical protein